MRWICVVALLSVVACSEKKEDGARDKAAAALASKDEKCPGGTVKGCFDAALEADRKGDSARAAEMHTRACDAGVAQACNFLGSMVWQGRGGLSADPARAYTLYMRACDGGDAAGCFSAAICHRTGSCAEKNDEEATKLLKRACQGGDARACANGGR
ncbi:sel1 repeat family protein [Archangium violaceum]|uniref:tetratricopeptide repeat protein n=1 Tax=Archangium violaceum TaxID=83451 RepID=UPI00194DCA0E|nr:SEL1-like repeat protein [Archangium violaceum]QRN94205.1 sel1 repeat family protein [Archangium violaceum]